MIRASISPSRRAAGKPGLDHLGIQVDNDDELKEIYARLHKAGGNVVEQGRNNLLLRQVGKVMDRRSGRHFVGDISTLPAKASTTATAPASAWRA